MPTATVIADCGEFIDVLQLLRRGRLLVHSEAPPGRWLIDGGGLVYHAHEPLASFGLLEELPVPAGGAVHAPHLHWYRLSPRGHDFAERACAQWKARPWWQRCWLRIVG
jgi:hypothetical protein